MLTKDQWIWVAENHKSVRYASVVALTALAFMYAYSMVDHWWAQGKASPVYERPSPTWMERLNCRGDDVGNMFIPTRRELHDRHGDMRDYVPGKLEIYDARPLHGEFYHSETIGEEVLDKRPECVGALIADLKNYPNPYAISIVQRISGRRIFRIARTIGYLDR